MQEILTVVAPYITPGAVKGVLALVALVGATVGSIRQKAGGTIPFLLAPLTWLALDLIACREPILNVGPTMVRLVLFALITAGTFLTWRFRFVGYINAVLLLTAAAAEGVLYLVSLVRGMAMLGTLNAALEAVYGIACGAVFVWGAVYSVRLALRKKEKSKRETAVFTAPASPLPLNVTLEEILPEPIAVHSGSSAAEKPASALPETLLQTGIGADILRAKRQLDAGEISAEEFKKRKTALMRREV